MIEIYIIRIRKCIKLCHALTPLGLFSISHIPVMPITYGRFFAFLIYGLFLLTESTDFYFFFINFSFRIIVNLSSYD